MKRASGICFVVFLVACTGLVHGVLNGTEVSDPSAFPYQAYLENEPGFLCSAVILSPKYVLGSGACASMASSDVSVIVGTNNPQDKSGQRHKVVATIIFPYYRVDSGIFYPHSVNDLALYKVFGKIKFSNRVQPVALPKLFEEVPDNTSAVLTGYGALEYGVHEKFPVNLQKLETRVMNHAQCKDLWLKYHFVSVSDTMICTIPEYATGACEGDSGSPLVANGTLVGISSFGYKCGWGRPDVYTRIASYVDWIEAVIE